MNDCLFVSSFIIFYVVAVWHSGIKLVSINEVTLHGAVLVLGWVFVCGRLNYHGM